MGAAPGDKRWEEHREDRRQAKGPSSQTGAVIRFHRGVFQCMGHRVSRIGPPRDLLVAPITLAAVAPDRPFSRFFASRNGSAISS